MIHILICRILFNVYTRIKLVQSFYRAICKKTHQFIYIRQIISHIYMTVIVVIMIVIPCVIRIWGQKFE